MSSTLLKRGESLSTLAAVAIIVMAIALSGCATGAKHRARTAELAEDFDQAVVEEKLRSCTND